MDPLICPLEAALAAEPHGVLREFRARFGELSWANESPDTLIGPVYSTATAIARLESQLVALYTAHLKVIEAVDAGERRDDEWCEYVRLYRVVRAFCVDWPVIGDREPITLDALRAPAALRLLYGRPDIVIGADGPRVVETNFDTAIAGFDQPDDMWRIAAEVFALDPCYRAMGQPIPGLASYFDERAGATPATFHWLMKNDAPTRAQYDRLVTDLNARSARARHRVHYAGEQVGPSEAGSPAYLHRACALLTVNQDRARFTTTLAHLARRTQSCTVPVGLSHVESKMFLAWLSDPGARPTTLTAEEVAAVAALVPWTRLIKRLHGDALERVRRNREDFIVKKADSYQARDVFFGCNLPQDAWSALLDTKRREPDVAAGTPNLWIVQERVRPKEHGLVEYTDAGIVERRTGVSCNPYLLGGRIRGLETWVTPSIPHLDMIRRTHFVPHFIRT